MATSSGSIKSTGIGSGLDATSIINQLMTLERAPLTRLEEQATSFNTKLSTIGKLQSNFATLRDKANALVSPTLWTGTTATVSDSTALKASTSASAQAGSYAVQTTALASGQTVVGATVASSSATLGPGTLTIELGSYATDGSFTGKTGSSAVSVTIGDGDTSLAAIRDKINGAGAGVVAAIVNDAAGARLTIRSRETGAENAFRITATEAGYSGSTLTAGDSGLGLAALAYDAGNASSPMSRTASASNAQATINGIAVSSATNTLKDVVEGMTFTLSKVSATPVNVEVASDTAAIKTAITDFVTAFNSAASFIRTQTAYNAETKVAGELQGDQGILALQSQLRAVINEGSTASSSFSRLSDIGLALKSDGTLETNTTKLDNALANLDETRKLLVTDGTGSADSGFARRFKRLTDAALGSEGTFDTRTASIKQRLDRNSKAQDAQELRLSTVQARLQSQYTALDTKMASLSVLSNYISQQISAMNSSS